MRWKAAVFDFGGVLVDWNPRYLYRKLFDGDEEAVEDFLATVCTMEWHFKHDAGRPMAEGVAELVAAFPDKADLIRAFEARWREMFRGQIEGSVEILHALKAAGVPLYGLTNYSSEKFDELHEQVDFLPLFDDILVSGKVGLIKPDPAIFRLMLARFGIDPSASIFVDDVPANIEAATAMGLEAVHFRGPEGLAKDLTSLGMLSGVV